jgi:ribosome-associated protein
MSRDIFVSPRVILPARDLSWKAVRASGPGGQNVNKVASKVELRFDLANTTALDWGAKGRLRSLAAGRIDADGAIVIVSQATRSQDQNLEDARQRLAELVSRALVVPKRRRPTKPRRGAVEKRLEGKRHQAHKKQGRRGGYDD